VDGWFNACVNQFGGGGGGGVGGALGAGGGEERGGVEGGGVEVAVTVGDVAGATGLGLLACGFFELFRSFSLASVSFNGARKPFVFHTPDLGLVSTPCSLICKNVAVGMVAIMMWVSFVWWI